MGSLVEFKANEEAELEKLEMDKAKETLLYAQASTLVEHDGKTLTNINDKLEIYKKIKRSSLLEFTHFLEQIVFGISDEKELVCPSCSEASLVYEEGCLKCNVHGTSRCA